MVDSLFLVHLAAMGALLFSLSCAVMTKDLLYSAVFLAIGSVTLGGIFFLQSSPFAGVVEISVGAGLVTALLATAISLTRREGDAYEQ
ncbi:MAG TPA: NADH-quinone oxidoreductase subunit J [Methanomicrobiales archaeon]|jgi:NADH:ubiquinone oxidoreductase subunit 6 (subunit J)|nr:NADH-quinone oxidoreductase subunit J [Methanomicrobiales archaeon]